jgi:Glycosyltransferase
LGGTNDEECALFPAVKISILQGAFLPVPALRGGAVEKMWFALGPEFAARGHEVTHVSRGCDGLAAEESICGVKHVRVRGYDRPAKLAHSLLLDLFYTWRASRSLPAADVVVTNTFWAPIVLPRRCGAIYVDVQRMPKGQMKRYGRAARLRANSSAVVQAILAEAPEAQARVRMIPNPLPFTNERPVEWGRKTKTILYAGRLHPEKGIELLLEAWRNVRASRKLDGWKLELIGATKGAEGGGGENWAAELQRKFSAADVSWYPPIYDAAELYRAYERATVFVYPSLAEKGETFGVAPLEAMAWGAVPVVSDLACFRDFIEPGANGFSFNHRGEGATHALARALEQAAGGEVREIAERTTRVRETHSNAKIAAQFLEDFATLVAARG